MNLNYLDRQLRKRKDLKHFEIKPIGSAIRLKRKELKMTLEEGAEGICSISYLSKLENNQIDPNLDFVDQLIERFGIREQIHYDEQKYQNDLIELTEKMVMQEELTRSYIEGYQDREDHQARVIHLIEMALRKDFHVVLDHFKVVTQFIPHLKQEELTLVLLSVCESLITSEQYRDAYHIVLSIPNAHETFYDHYLLTLRMRLKLSFLMHKTSDINLLYQHYLKEVDQQGYYHLSKEMKLCHLVHLSYYHVPSEIETLSKSVDRKDELEKKPYAISCFTHQQFDEVIRIVQSKDDLSGWLILYLLALEELHRFEEIKYILKNRLPEKLKQSEHILVNHMREKYEHDQKKCLNYLRRDVLGNRIQCDDPHLLEYMMLDSSRLFAKSQFYKESTLIVSTYQPKIKLLRIAHQKMKDEA
jgi:transcriptional regulator with XRE-family HTH domain